jgi:flagellar hook-associated protein 2
MANVDLSISGLVSGMDWKSVVSQLANAERSPETKWLTTQNKVNQQNSVYTSIKSYLNNVQSYAQALKKPDLYQSRAASSSAATVATASAATGTTIGSYTFAISQLATASSQTGASGISQGISTGSDLSTVTIGAANFATPVTAGTFTVNGQQVTIATTDSLQSVFDKIASATSNAVTASYNASTDKLTLNSSSAITLGSAADSSNFLQAAKLYNNSTGTITSSDTLGRINTGATLAGADFATPVSDGGSGNGEFKINGVSISFSATADTVQNVIDRINSSGAGVTAAYDSVNNRFSLLNNSTGNVGIALQDVTGNFLAASGLSGGTFKNGQNLTYTLNGGNTLTSLSNTIDATSSGVTGLSVNALTTGSTTVTVAGDTSALSTAVQNFVNAYNTVQSYITTQSASTTSSSGTVSTNALTGDLGAAELASNLRNTTLNTVSIAGLTDTYSNLAGLGVTSNGHNNTVTLDTTALNNALTNHLSDVQKLFSDATNGLATKMDTFLTNTVGDTGTISTHQTALTKQSTGIDTQISNLEKQIAADSAYWTSQFQAMETAMSGTNRQLTYLQQSVNNGTL